MKQKRPRNLSSELQHLKSMNRASQGNHRFGISKQVDKNKENMKQVLQLLHTEKTRKEGVWGLG